MNNEILVTGATGQQGGAVVKYLMKQGIKPRILTRDPKKAQKLKEQGLEVFQGDLTDRASLDKALKGIKTMFLVTTPYEAGIEAEVNQGITAVEAAKAAGVEYIVFSSVGSAQRETGIPHFESKRKVELRIEDLGFKHAIIRPVFFMDNFGAFWLLPAVQNGVVALPMSADRKLAMVAVDNIGEFCAMALLHPEIYDGEEIELAGEELTIPDALSIISKASGKELVYQEVPRDQAEKAFGPDFGPMFVWFQDIGYNPDIPNLEKEYGIRLQRFSEHLKSAPWLKLIQTQPVTK